MEETCLVSGLYTATNEDVISLPSLLLKVPEQIFVHNEFTHVTIPLRDLVRLPHEVVEEEGFFVLYSRDAKTEERVSLRIIRENGQSNILQCRNKKYKVWGESPPNNTLLLPAELLKNRTM